MGGCVRERVRGWDGCEVCGSVGGLVHRQTHRGALVGGCVRKGGCVDGCIGRRSGNRARASAWVCGCVADECEAVSRSE